MGKLLDQILSIQSRYPTLRLDNQNFILAGRLDVDGDDHFFVEIDFRPWGLYRYRSFPLAKEIGGRIPPEEDRHVYPESEYCCLTTRFMEEILLRRDIRTLADFFREILIPYFLRQIYYEIEGEYDDELEHGVPGIIQPYEEILGISDLDLLVPLMEGRVLGRKLGRNDKCYCGQDKLKRCKPHYMNYETFRLASPHVIESDLTKIKAWRALKQKEDNIMIEAS